MTRCRRGGAILGAVALCSALAACGSSSHTTSPATATTTTPSRGVAAVRDIERNWTTFFDGRTPARTRIDLVQDGAEFAATIDAQVHSVLAAAASAKVTAVRVAPGGSTATVTYDILEGGTVALSRQTGTAVYEGGTWKVGAASFCGLLSLESGGKSSGLPAACAHS
jgi:hypothetical protein